MVNSDIWMGSGATVSMIPEQKLYLGTFSGITTPSSGTNSIATASITTAGTQILSSQTVLTDAEIDAGTGGSGSGGELALTLSAHSTAFTFADNDGSVYEDGSSNDGSIRIYADNGDGTQTSIDVVFADDSGSTPTLGGDVTLTVDIAEDAEGAEIAEAVRIALVDSGEAINATRSGNVLTVTNTNGGYVTDSTETTDDGVTLTNTAGGVITAVVINTAGSGYTAGTINVTSSGGTTGVITITVTSSSTNQAVIALNTSFTANFTLLTNMYRGCYLNIHAATGDALTDRVLIQSNAAGTITVNNSLASDITGTPTAYYGVIEQYGAVVPGYNASNAQLLSDHWIGLATNIGIPSTQVQRQEMNLLGGGTRNYIYQFKTMERTSGGSIDLNANSFWPLYYALGVKNITSVEGEESVSISSQFALSSGSGTGFIYHPSADVIHRTEDTVIIPPLPPDSVYAHSGYKKIPHDNMDTEFITYAITTEEGHQLPSFGLEYTLKKGDQNTTVAVDASKENVYSKIYPGTVVSTLGLSASTDGPVTMNLTLAHKKTYVAPSNYQTLNGVTDIKEFINFGGRQGETESLASTSSLDCEELMRPFFFSDGTVSMFGQDYIRLASFNLNIENGITETAYIGRYDKDSVNQLNGQRTYSLSFTGHVTDAAIFNELQNQLATACSTLDGNEIVLRFTKENGEQLELKFMNYMVSSANFPVNTTERGPVMVDWEIIPLELASCEIKTYWAIQG